MLSFSARFMKSRRSVFKGVLRERLSRREGAREGGNEHSKAETSCFVDRIGHGRARAGGMRRRGWEDFRRI